MRVSIVTAVLNGAGTLEETIHSVLSQEHDDVEHVVVDGGSTDGTLEIIRAFESRIGPWVSERDGGISPAFNRGIRMSTGEVVGIISADDYLWPGALREVVRVFEENPQADVVYGNAVYVEPHRGRQVLSRPDVGLTTIRRRASLRHAAVFVRRAAYDRYGLFDEGYRLAMDYDLILRFHLAGARFVYVDAPLAAIRVGGVSGQRFRETIREAREISIRHGLSPVVAHLISAGDLVKTLAKERLERSRLGWLIDGYRRLSPRFAEVGDGALAREAAGSGGTAGRRP